MKHETVTPSPFLRLPGELRNGIYTHTLGSHILRILPPASPKTENIKHTGVIIVTPDLPPPSTTHAIPIPFHDLLNLLLVCKQIYQETRLLPFEWNIFEIQDMRLFSLWIEERLTEGQRDAVEILYCRRIEAYMVGKMNQMPATPPPSSNSTSPALANPDADSNSTANSNPDAISTTEVASFGDLRSLRNLKKVCLTGPRTGGFFPRGWEDVCVRGLRMATGKGELEVGFETEEEWLSVKRDGKAGQRPEGA